MKYVLTLFLLSWFTAGFAQQNRKLLRIKEKYDNRLKTLQDKCFGNSGEIANPEKMKVLDQKCEAEENILEIKRSAENAAELAKIKTNNRKKSANIKVAEVTQRKADLILPQYPTGLNGFRKEVGENFNTAVISGNNILRTEISFVVEPDGSISGVESDGNNIPLNREAEIAVYLAKHRWKPATENGVAVPYRFNIPMSFYFE